MLKALQLEIKANQEAIRSMHGYLHGLIMGWTWQDLAYTYTIHHCLISLP